MLRKESNLANESRGGGLPKVYSESAVLRKESNLARESRGGNKPWSYSESLVLRMESNLDKDASGAKRLPSCELKESNLEKSLENSSGPSLNLRGELVEPYIGVLGTESAKGLFLWNMSSECRLELYAGVLGTESKKGLCFENAFSVL